MAKKTKRARGGIATLKKYGPDHFRKLAKRMHRLRRAKQKEAQHDI